MKKVWAIQDGKVWSSTDLGELENEFWAVRNFPREFSGSFEVFDFICEFTVEDGPPILLKTKGVITVIA